MLALILGIPLYLLGNSVSKLDTKKYPVFSGLWITFVLLTVCLYTGYCLYSVYDDLSNWHFAIPVRLIR